MPSLVAQHCLNHSAREAVAQCPECRHFFCRECITEHDDRVICAACLRKISQAARPQRHPFRALGRAGLSLAGLVIAGLFFYLIGQVLLTIPASFHDGTLWKTVENWSQ